MSSYLNALLEGALGNERKSIVSQFFDHAVSTWTVPGILTVHGEDDHRRLMEMLSRFPVMQQALATRIATAAVPTMMMMPAPSAPPPQAAFSPIICDPSRITPGLNAHPYRPEIPHSSGTPHALPKRPLQLRDAREKYRKHYQKSLDTQTERTADDKERLFTLLSEYLSVKHPELGPDPWIHEIDADHISGFLSDQAERPAKANRQTQGGSHDRNAGAEDAKFITVSPRTLLKKFSDLNHFFSYLKGVAKATLENPLSDLEEMTEAWRVRAKAADIHYRPFNDVQLQQIFFAEDLLVNTREPDYFWCPLLGLHLGVRLGEVVNREMSDIGYLAEIDCWYIDIPEGKNNNSIRRLPITAPLIELGFLRYVERVRTLGGEHLFPHRDWAGATAERDPSKNQSRNFAAHMHAIGLPDPMLVFHSFRHTVVTAMQDAGVPLSHAMQIAGHEAQDHAIKTGRITTEQSRSIHLSTYTHTDSARLGIDYPILELKSALERSIKPPIDYKMLARAGDLVAGQLRKVGEKFVSGWPPQKEKFTQKMINSLRQA